MTFLTDNVTENPLPLRLFQSLGFLFFNVPYIYTSNTYGSIWKEEGKGKMDVTIFSNLKEVTKKFTLENHLSVCTYIVLSTFLFCFGVEDITMQS